MCYDIFTSMKKVLSQKIFKIVVYIFAIIGFVLVAVYFSVQFGLTNDKGIIDKQHDYFKNQNNYSVQDLDADKVIWGSDEWKVLKEAIKKDKNEIISAANTVNISPRLLVSVLIVEQLRLFNSEREIFKQVFAPLKILGNQSQFSWGVMGIKQDTAKEIEYNLGSSTSPFYLGPELVKTLAYNMPNSTETPADIDSLRFARLTNEDNRSYSYLYGAILLKQIETQWKNAGFPIDDKPGVVATLYNIGFKNSIPKSAPSIGGAEINIGDKIYSFGGLAEAFYYSGELKEDF